MNFTALFLTSVLIWSMIQFRSTPQFKHISSVLTLKFKFSKELIQQMNFSSSETLTFR